MPKIPVYQQQVDLAAGSLGPRAGAELEAPGRALASFGRQVGETAFRFGMMEKEKQVKDKDAELSETIGRDVSAIANDANYTTANDAKQAVQLYKNRTFADIDALDMTRDQKRQLKLSASKSISMIGLQAEQKAFGRGLEESGKNANALIDSKMDMINSLAPGDARIEMLRADIDKYRQDAYDNNYAAYLKKDYQDKTSTNDAMSMRLVSGILADESITEQQVETYESQLGSSFEKAEITEKTYRSTLKILSAKKSAIRAKNKADDPDGIKQFVILRDDLLFKDGVTYAEIDTLREDIESGRGDYKDVPKEKRRTLLAPVVAELNSRKQQQIGVLSQKIEVMTDEIATTGKVSPELSANLADLNAVDEVAGQKMERAVEAGGIAAGYIANMELASSEDWANNIADLESEYDLAQAKATREGASQDEIAKALALKDALGIAQKANADRIAAIKENPRGYYNAKSDKAVGVPSEIRGTDAGTAEYVEWVRSTGLIREDEITVFTPEQAENLIEQMKGASPVGKRAIYEEAKQRMPGVSQRILMQSFKKSGISTVDNLLMVLHTNPIAGDLNAAVLIDDKDLKAQIGDTEVEKNIAAAVSTEMVDFNKSILGSVMDVDGFTSRAAMGAEGAFGGRASFVNDTNKAVLKLARYYVATQDMSASDAAKRAAKVHTDQFSYGDINGQPLRVPKQFGDPDRIAAGLSAVLDGIDAKGPDGSYLSVQEQNGTTPQERLVATELYVKELKRSGSWMTSADSQGAYMIDMFGNPVKGADGKPIEIKFQSVSGTTSISVADFGPGA
tara:strand:- start:4393 stop:6777 length:2385 start_codon:yes stop_codon:yes gene_type:complete